MQLIPRSIFGALTKIEPKSLLPIRCIIGIDCNKTGDWDNFGRRIEARREWHAHLTDHCVLYSMVHKKRSQSLRWPANIQIFPINLKATITWVWFPTLNFISRCRIANRKEPLILSNSFLSYWNQALQMEMKIFFITNSPLQL